MKKMIIIVCVGIASFGPFQHAAAQSDEIAQLVLNIQKLAQLKKILTNMKKGYEILNGGYNTVKNIAEGNFNIHKDYLDGLLSVSPTVRNYKRVAEIINYQRLLVEEYNAAYERFQSAKSFSAAELAYLGRVYDRLLKSSLRNLEELIMVITAGKTRMSDDERLQAIDRIYLDMEEKLTFLRDFNGKTNVLILQRGKERNDVKSMRGLYGIEQ